MRIRIEKDLPILLFLLVSASTLASLPQVQSAWDGVPESYEEQDFGLRLLREAMLAITMVYIAFERKFWSTVLTSGVLAFLTLLGGYIVFEVAYALYLGLPLVVPLAGLRVFEYLPLALVGLMVGRMGWSEPVISKFVSYLRYFIVVQGVLAVAQTLWAPPVFGVSMLGGGRAFGTFVSPNNFGTAMATCALFFALPRTSGLRKWVYISAALALLSGSRTALLSAGVVILFETYLALRPRDRWVLALPAPLLAVGALFLASNSAISGRNTDLTEEGRISIWQDVLTSNIEGPWDLLFGWGLGLGSNTITVLFGPGYFPGQFISDSLYLFILNGFGLLGLIAYLVLLWFTLQSSHYPTRGLVILFIFITGLPFNIWEYFPHNAMLMFLWGVVWGFSRQSPPRESHIPADIFGQWRKY